MSDKYFTVGTEGGGGGGGGGSAPTHHHPHSGAGINWCMACSIIHDNNC